MANLLKLEIVTPDRSFFSGDVEMVVVRTTEGDIGILYDHEPLVAPISVGAVRIKQDGKFTAAACSGGFISVDEDVATIITDTAEWAHEIDVERAKSAKERAEAVLKNAEARELDVVSAKVSLTKAANRLHIADVYHTKR